MSELGRSDRNPLLSYVASQVSWEEISDPDDERYDEIITNHAPEVSYGLRKNFNFLIIFERERWLAFSLPNSRLYEFILSKRLRQEIESRSIGWEVLVAFVFNVMRSFGHVSEDYFRLIDLSTAWKDIRKIERYGKAPKDKAVFLGKGKTLF